MASRPPDRLPTTASTRTPLTPTKQAQTDVMRAAVHSTIERLNRDFGLGLSYPDNTRSPRKKGEHADRIQDRIHSALRLQYFHGDLPGVADEFRVVVKEQWQPQAAAGPSVPSRLSHRATTPIEHEEMQTMLLEYLRARCPIPQRRERGPLKKSYSEGAVMPRRDNVGDGPIRPLPRDLLRGHPAVAAPDPQVQGASFGAAGMRRGGGRRDLPARIGEELAGDLPPSRPKRPSDGLEKDMSKRPRPAQTTKAQPTTAKPTAAQPSPQALKNINAGLDGIPMKPMVLPAQGSFSSAAPPQRTVLRPQVRYGRPMFPIKKSSNSIAPINDGLAQKNNTSSSVQNNIFVQNKSNSFVPNKNNSFVQNNNSFAYSYSTSANTSKVSLASAVFSTTGDDNFPSTQTTVEAPTQEQEDRVKEKLSNHHDRVVKQEEQTRMAGPDYSMEDDVEAFYESFYVPRVHEENNSNRPLIASPTANAEAFYESFYEPRHRQEDSTSKQQPPTSPTPTVKKISMRGNKKQRDTTPRKPARESSPVTGSDVYSSFPEMLEISTPRVPGVVTLPAAQNPVSPRKRQTFEERLGMVWPTFPMWLSSAPFAVAWEVTRVALHCGVDLSEMKMTYSPSWEIHGAVWRALYKRPEFRGRSFPEQTPKDVWDASLDTFKAHGRSVVLSALLDFNSSPEGPFFKLRLQPMKLERPSRLSRRFGSDRFLELLFPSPNSSRAPRILEDKENVKILNRWLTRESHGLVSRRWAAFYTKDAGYKKPITDVTLGQEPKMVFKDRVYLFAVDGDGFRPGGSVPARDEQVDARSQFSVQAMLDWLLQPQHHQNQRQPYLKLFSRIALGLSKISPTVVFEPQQIRRMEQDLLSPRGKEMNDGIGRMSRAVAKKIREILGLTEVPCAVQGRLGSAKGMWIVDIEDPGYELWIETYPSQRKWECDLSDPAQRTLEVRDHARDLRSANLNLQFLPVLESRSRDKPAMREAIGGLLANNLKTELEAQRGAMRYSIEFRLWVHANSSHRSTRADGYIPFLGGIPEKDEEVMNMLLEGGFDPKEQRYLQDIAWRLQKQKCDILKKKLNIRVGRSTYAYMVVDFWGLLAEDEVHMCFSSKFQADEDDFSATILDGVDVLVARSPAHYVSDIQKVRAVFRPELKDLQDVIVFPRKGAVALADKLSGGDYDGDIAWVCWDPNIVDNFVNADVPDPPDLFKMGYLGKVKDTMQDLLVQHGTASATAELIERSFLFNMRQNYLGICTNYKERLCYKRGSVEDIVAVRLSTLLSNLVDQAKQGIEFSANEWRRFKKDVDPGGGVDPGEPAYKVDHWGFPFAPTHIIDYLKFNVAMPLIEEELAKFHKAMNPKKHQGVVESGGTANAKSSPTKGGGKGSGDGGELQFTAKYQDKDLEVYYNFYKGMGSSVVKKLLTKMELDIAEVHKAWRMTKWKGAGGGSGGGDAAANAAAVGATAAAMDGDSVASFADNVNRIYKMWLGIRPDVSQHKSLPDSKMVAMLAQPFLDEQLSQWRLLVASATYKLCYDKGVSFVWRMAGRQLVHIKAQVVTSRQQSGLLLSLPSSSGVGMDMDMDDDDDDDELGIGGRVRVGSRMLPATVIPEMHAMMRPDNKLIRQTVARMEGSDSHYTGAEDGEQAGQEEGEDGIGSSEYGGASGLAEADWDYL